MKRSSIVSKFQIGLVGSLFLLIFSVFIPKTLAVEATETCGVVSVSPGNTLPATFTTLTINLSDCHTDISQIAALVVEGENEIRPPMIVSVNSGSATITLRPTNFVSGANTTANAGQYSIGIYKSDQFGLNLDERITWVPITLEGNVEVSCGTLTNRASDCPTTCGSTQIASDTWVCRESDSAFFDCDMTFEGGNSIYPGQTKTVNISNLRLPNSITNPNWRNFSLIYRGTTNQFPITGSSTQQTLPATMFQSPNPSGDYVKLMYHGDGSVGPYEMCQSSQLLRVSEETCQFNKSPIYLSTDQSYFYLAFTIRGAGLAPNSTYKIYYSFSDSYDNFDLATITTSGNPANDSFPFIFDSTNPFFSYARFEDRTIEVFLERQVQAGEGNSNVACKTAFTFGNINNTDTDTDGILEEVEPPGLQDPGETLPLANLCFQAGTHRAECEQCTGIWTALGCIPANEREIVIGFSRLLMGLAGGAALLVILFGAFTISTSRNDPQRLQQGNEMVTSAIIGLLFIILSVIILRFIGVDILAIPGFI